METLVWDEEMTLGAQKEEEKLSLDALFDEEIASEEAMDEKDFEEEIVSENEVLKEESTESLLDRIEGEVGEASSRIELKSPINTKRNIARFKDGKFELIGLAPVTVIEASDLEIALMQADHILKNGKLGDRDKANAYKFEQENLETVQSLFGVDSVAELNGISEEELSRYFRKELKESAKIMLENVMAETGISEVSTATINYLADMDSPTERDIFKAIIRELK